MMAAWRTVAKRLLLVLPVLWIVVSLIFFLIHLVPGDPVEQMLGKERRRPISAHYATPMVWMSRWALNTSAIGTVCCTATWANLFASIGQLPN